MNDVLVPLADELRTTVAAGGRRLIIGIVGAPGTGKSTAARLLQELLGDDLCAVVPMDGFHLSQAVIRGTELEARKGASDTFDVGGYLSLLERLHRNAEDVIYAPDYRRSIEDPIAAAIKISKSIEIVLTEGNYLLATNGRWPEAQKYFDEAWFVETPDDVRISRLIKRHVAFGKSTDFATEWATGTDQRNAELVIATKARADRIIPWS